MPAPWSRLLGPPFVFSLIPLRISPSPVSLRSPPLLLPVSLHPPHDTLFSPTTTLGRAGRRRAHQRVTLTLHFPTGFVRRASLLTLLTLYMRVILLRKRNIMFTEKQAGRGCAPRRKKRFNAFHGILIMKQEVTSKSRSQRDTSPIVRDDKRRAFKH